MKKERKMLLQVVSWGIPLSDRLKHMPYKNLEVSVQRFKPHVALGPL